EDGIRYFHVTGVQTCALPISPLTAATEGHRQGSDRGQPCWVLAAGACTERVVACTHQPYCIVPGGTSAGRRGLGLGGRRRGGLQIGRASCRERGEVD